MKAQLSVSSIEILRKKSLSSYLTICAGHRKNIVIITKKNKIKADSLMSIIWKHVRNKTENSYRSNLSCIGQVLRRIVDLKRIRRIEMIKRIMGFCFGCRCLNYLQS